MKVRGKSAWRITILPEPSPDNVTPLSEVTKEDLKNWVIETQGGDLFMQSLNDHHNYQLANQAVLKVATPVPALEEVKVKTTADLADEVRLQRDQALYEADTLVNKALDNGVDPGMYRAYRQALRDIPKQTGFPTDVSWPVAPPDPS